MSRHRTQKVELVETHNLAVSIQRLRSGDGGYDDGRWRRALYHAICMQVNEWDIRQKIREALKLP